MSDLISRKDALDILCKFCGITEDVEKCRKTSADGWCKEYSELKNMPTVDAVAVRRGTWEMRDDPYGFFDKIPVCSVCGHTTEMRRTYPYCPHCGAKMDAERKEE